MTSIINKFFKSKDASQALPKQVKHATRRASKSSNSRLVETLDRMAFNWPMREILYRHLSAQIANGVGVEQALDNMHPRLIRGKKVTPLKIVKDVSRRMRDGATLTDALSNWIPQDELGVIESGELSGNVSRSLDLLMDSKRRIRRVNSAMKSGITRPIIYTIAMLVTLWIIGKFVTPSLQHALPFEKSTGVVKGLYVASDFVGSFWVLVPIAVMVAIPLIIVRLMPRWTGPGRILAEKFFPFSFYRDTNGFTWLMSFAALLRAGMVDVEILKRQSKNASPWLKERLRAIWWRMDNGKSLPEALLQKGKNNLPAFGFPNPDIVDDISSLAEFADFAERITKVAEQWAQDLETSVLAKATRFGLYTELVIYFVMGLLMYAINEMSSQMGNLPGM